MDALFEIDDRNLLQAWIEGCGRRRRCAVDLAPAAVSGVRFAFYGRTSPAGYQDPVTSRVWQREVAESVIAGHGEITVEFMDVGCSREVAWARRPQAAALLAAARQPRRLFHTKRYRVQVQVSGDARWNGNNRMFTDWLDAYRHGLNLAQRWTLVEEVRVIPDLDGELLEGWYQLGMKNPWIKEADDPAFTRASFVGCYSISELAEAIGHGNWTVGTAFYYRDLCFINQEAGKFTPLVRRIPNASREQCQRLGY